MINYGSEKKSIDVLCYSAERNSHRITLPCTYEEAKGYEAVCKELCRIGHKVTAVKLVKDKFGLCLRDACIFVNAAREE